MNNPIQRVSSIFTRFALIAGLVACGGEYPLDEEQADQAMTNTGGGGLGYTCTTTSNGTTCTCDPTQGDDSHPDTCTGMGKHCHGKGADITCRYPVGKPASCECTYGVRRLGSTSRSFSGGASSAAP